MWVSPKVSIPIVLDLVEHLPDNGFGSVLCQVPCLDSDGGLIFSFLWASSDMVSAILWVHICRATAATHGALEDLCVQRHPLWAFDVLGRWLFPIVALVQQM